MSAQATLVIQCWAGTRLRNSVALLFHRQGSVTRRKRNVISLTVWKYSEQGKEANHLKTLAGIALVFLVSLLCPRPSFLCWVRDSFDSFSPPEYGIPTINLVLLTSEYERSSDVGRL